MKHDAAKTRVVLAMHGMPPRDFPQAERQEFRRLRVAAPESQAFLDLEQKIRQWPRTKENDPFFVAAKELGERLEARMRVPVLCAFNEFCAPSLPEAFDQAVEGGAKQIIVVTPMVTRGGNHAESEIPEQIQDAKTKHSHVHFSYAWPFDTEDLADFLFRQIDRSHPDVTANAGLR